MLERPVGRHLNHHLGLDPHDVDVLAAPVADMSAADRRWPRMIIASRGQQRSQGTLLERRQRRGSTDDVQLALVEQAEHETLRMADRSGDGADDDFDRVAVAILQPVTGAAAVGLIEAFPTIPSMPTPLRRTWQPTLRRPTARGSLATTPMAD